MLETNSLDSSSRLVRTTLGNGLHVVLDPDLCCPAVCITVHYNVGIRSEPQGRTGFAHLFEHLMFQGSANLEKLAHSHYVESSGGMFNGSTHLDYTNYYMMLPSNALERGLFLAADQMRGPRITSETLANQVDVVKEEVRAKVLNRPYGGFPWLLLPPVLFDKFPNAHNGYGDFSDLESVSMSDAEDFFHHYYSPANAVLCVTGGVDVADTLDAVERHFGSIPERPVPPRPDCAEEDLTAERHEAVTDPQAPMPALAMGWRVPDPVVDLRGYVTCAVLADVLTSGDAARLQQALTQRNPIVAELSCQLGLMGSPFDERDPTALVCSAVHRPDVSAAVVLSAVDTELDRLACDGLAPGELARVAKGSARDLLHEADGVRRALVLATLEQQHGRAELLTELRHLFSAITEDEVRQAAAALRPQRRAVVEVRPGA